MKTYTIGRDLACDIVINDDTDVISRRHAVLKVEDNGTMTITDISSNGTYINGIRMNSNEPVPVTRKDTVSFAHVSNLDWNRIPAPAKKKNSLLFGVIAVLVIAIVAIILWLGNKEPKENPESGSVPTVDSIVNTVDSITAPVDSIKNDKAQSDTIENKVEAGKVKEPKVKDRKDSKKDKVEDKKESEPAKKDSTNVSKRAIG